MGGGKRAKRARSEAVRGRAEVLARGRPRAYSTQSFAQRKPTPNQLVSGGS
jgi:hypothetical protein